MTFISHSLRAGKSKIMSPEDSVSGENPIPHRPLSFCCNHTWWSGGGSFPRALIPFIKAASSVTSHTMQCTADVLQNCVLETYILLLTSVTPINSITFKTLKINLKRLHWHEIIICQWLILLNTITLGVRILRCKFVEETNIQTIAPFYNELSLGSFKLDNSVIHPGHCGQLMDRCSISTSAQRCTRNGCWGFSPVECKIWL